MIRRLNVVEPSIVSGSASATEEPAKTEQEPAQEAAQEADDPNRLRATPRDPDGRFKALARREQRSKRKLEERERAIAEREQRAAIAANERSEYEALRALKARVADDPYGVARELGISVDKLTEQVLADGKPEAEIAKLRAENAARDKAEKDRQEAAERSSKLDRERRFVAEAEADEYGALAGADPDMLVAEAYRVAPLITRRL